MTGDCFTAQQMTTGIAVVLAKFSANFFRKFYVLFGDRLRIISKWRLQGTLLRRQLVFLFELPGGRDINDDESSEANDGDAEVDHILSVTVTVIMLKRISLSQVHRQGVGVFMGAFANVSVGAEEEEKNQQTVVRRCSSP